MHPTEPQPLWRTVVGDTEPWRRGRLFLVLYAALSFCLQCLSLGLSVVSGDIERLLALGIFVLFFWLQSYLIWIGIHWVRWLNGGWNALAGFAFIIWGWRDNATVIVVIGFYLLVVGAYLSLAPSVYFFAKRQRESVRWTEAIVVGVVFLLLLGSVFAAVVGLVGYKERVEKDAHQFADAAFHSIFSEHDTYFLLDHTSDRLQKAAGGREGMTQILQQLTLHEGDVHDTQAAAGSLRFYFAFPSHLESAGDMIADGTGDRGPLRMHLRIEREGRDWVIDGIWWDHPGSAPRQQPRR